ncbi:MAG: VOC family protein [Pseudomonadota bacterium]
MNNQTSLLGTPTARDVAIFVPARDFALSLRFYRELGWKENWRNGGLAQLELAGQRFLLQDYYARKWADNFMMYITVDDAEAWFHHAIKLVEGGEFDDARATPPKREPHGATVTHVWDPCGVLLHFAQPDA